MLAFDHRKYLHISCSSQQQLQFLRHEYLTYTIHAPDFNDMVTIVTSNGKERIFTIITIVLNVSLPIGIALTFYKITRKETADLSPKHEIVYLIIVCVMRAGMLSTIFDV